VEAEAMPTIEQVKETSEARGSAASAEGWDLEGIPPRFWPRIRELLRAREFHEFQPESHAVASALVSALAVEAIARKAGGAGEGMAKAATAFVADWDGELCPPYHKWPPRKKRLIAEEVLEILAGVFDAAPEGHFANTLRGLGASMQEKLDAAGAAR
jgi:hypothetical protein